MPVVARGRYVEIATDRDEVVCAGTVQFMDRFVEAGFALLGEQPPDRAFVRYEWLSEPEEGMSVFSRGGVRRIDGDVLVQSDHLVEEHELAHAVHQGAWPYSAKFLHEGLAVLLDPRHPFMPGEWRGADLDAVLEARELSAVEYYDAWFLVSQIVADHGMAGLRDLWHAVPAGASAAQVRDAYLSLFGQPIDVLIEPWVWDLGEMGEEERTRGTCSVTLCTGMTLPAEADGESWAATGPTSCADDPDAIGPFQRSGTEDGPPVWRDYVMDPGQYLFEQDPANDLGAVQARPCGLECVYLAAYEVDQGSAPDEPFREDTRVRIEVHSELEALPTETPIEVIFHRSSWFD